MHAFYKGKNHSRWLGGKSRTKKCKICNKKLHITSIYRNYKMCKSCAKTGKNNPNYIHGKTGKNKCKRCLKHICDAAKYCNKCEKYVHKKRLIESMAKIINHKHHLDLNIKNNTPINLWILPKGKHQIFHRFAYHYLLEKFGISEILKYKKWFISRYMTERK